MAKPRRTTKKGLSIRITRCGFVAHCIFTYYRRIYCFVEMLRMDVFVWVRCCYFLRHFFCTIVAIRHCSHGKLKSRSERDWNSKSRRQQKLKMKHDNDDYRLRQRQLFTYTDIHIHIVSFNLHSKFTICHTLNSFVSHCSLCLFDTFGFLWKLRMYERIFAIFQPLRW